MKRKVKIPQFTIVLKGTDRGGKMRLWEFIKSLEVIVAALKDTEQRLTGYGKSLHDYKIVRLSQNSPAKITIEPVLDKTTETGEVLGSEQFDTLLSNLKFIKKEKSVPRGLDYHAVEKYRDIGDLRTGHLSEITVASGRKKVTIDEKFKNNIYAAIGEDEYEYDTLVGKLDVINIHQGNIFYIYPILGAKRVKCIFNDSMTDQVIRAFGSRIEVTGKVRYKSWDKFPYAINVEKIFIYPKDEELPTFSDIMGMAPDITGQRSITDFIRTIRDEY